MKRILLLSFFLFSNLCVHGMHFSGDYYDEAEYLCHEEDRTKDSEGLLAGTLVKVPFGYSPIEDLKIGDRVISRNDAGILETDFVIAVERRKVDKVVHLGVAGESIIVADGHRLFTPLIEDWIEAHRFSHDDSLLSFPRTEVSIDFIEILQGEFDVVTISIENNHNFFVSENDILVHNVLPALPLIAAVAKPLAVAVGKALLAAAVKEIAYQATKKVTKNEAIAETVANMAGRCSSNYMHGERTYEGVIGISSDASISATGQSDQSPIDISFDFSGKGGAQAPGMPTINDGYKPPKNWDGKKVRSPRGYGWPDNRGNIWVPSGPNGHGGPHWDVQKPDGDYENIVPGGKER